MPIPWIPARAGMTRDFQGIYWEIALAFTRIWYNSNGDFPNRQYAHRRKVSSNPDDCCVARPERAVDFRTRPGGCVRVSARSLPVRRASPRFKSCLLYGQERTVWNAIYRKRPQHSSRQLAVCTCRTLMVGTSRGLEFQPRCLKLKPFALPRADSGPTSSILSLIADLRWMIAGGAHRLSSVAEFRTSDPADKALYASSSLASHYAAA